MSSSCESTYVVEDAPIRRERVQRMLDTSARVTTVIAPPGYGKTTALHEWCADSLDGTVPVAFVPAAARWRGAAPFWHELVTRLRDVLPDPDGLLAGLAARPSPDRDLLGALVSWFETQDTPVTVILDDLATLTDRSVLDGLALLVERVGGPLRLIVSGRGDPGLPLALWRSRGWVADLGALDLAFTGDEAADLAESLGTVLDAGAVQTLNRLVEGWPLAVHLGLLAGDAPIDAPTGLRRRIRDHIVGEIVDLLTEHQQRVALALSVPPAFDIELSRRLLGDESVPVVRELLRLGIFLRIDDGERGVIRYHGLVRSVLERELRERDPRAHALLSRRVRSLGVVRSDRTVLRPLPAPAAATSPPSSRDVPVVAAAHDEFALTNRELSLLEFLPSHLSYAQIAARTFLSVNTVKSNLKSIYRKLGVTSRAEAVDRSRDAGLI